MLVYQRVCPEFIWPLVGIWYQEHNLGMQRWEQCGYILRKLVAITIGLP